jgi:hypothetical protein
MRKLIVFLVPAMAVVALMLLPTANATTAPTLTVHIHVVLTDGGIIVGTKKSYRGWYANFIVVNHGTKPHKFEIGGLTTPTIAPGKRYVLKVSLDLRGSVTYTDPLNPGPHSSGVFTVV